MQDVDHRLDVEVLAQLAALDPAPHDRDQHLADRPHARVRRSRRGARGRPSPRPARAGPRGGAARPRAGCAGCATSASRSPSRLPVSGGVARRAAAAPSPRGPARSWSSSAGRWSSCPRRRGRPRPRCVRPCRPCSASSSITAVRMAWWASALRGRPRPRAGALPAPARSSVVVRLALTPAPPARPRPTSPSARARGRGARTGQRRRRSWPPPRRRSAWCPSRS